MPIHWQSVKPVGNAPRSLSLIFGLPLCWLGESCLALPGPPAAWCGNRGEKALGDRNMISLAKRNCPWLRSSLVALLGFSPAALAGEDPRNQVDTTAPVARAGMSEINRINRDWEQALLSAAAARRNAKSPSDLERVRKESSTNERGLVERCVDLANRQPGSISGLIALKMIACRSPETEEGKKAAEALVKQAASHRL